jgi:hypothetical protein
MKSIYPFNYLNTNKDDRHYCPKCAGKYQLFQRKICKKRTKVFGFVVYGRDCPEAEHFHHECSGCGSDVCELTLDVKRGELGSLIYSVYKLAEKLGMNEEQFRDEYRSRVIDEVMKE